MTKGRAPEPPRARPAVERESEDDFVPLYGNEDAWNEMVLRVTTGLAERVSGDRR